MTHAPRRPKRSRAARVVLLGAAVATLAACEDDSVETSVFPDLDTCLAAADQPDGWLTADQCETAFAEALVAYDDQAPRYDDRALCEAEHDGECIVEERAGGGSVFLPLMTGFLIGNMLNRGGVAAQPLVKTGTGAYSTPAGATFNTNRGTGTVRETSFRSAPSTKTAAPMTRATVRSTGGFGASGGSRGVGG